jgi:hypothetical protein
LTLLLLPLATITCAPAAAADVLLENRHLAAKFDPGSGSLIQLANQRTGEVMEVRGDEFKIVALEFTLLQKEASLVSLTQTSDELVQAMYQADRCNIVAEYRLGKNHHFLEKRLVVTPSSPYGFKDVVISAPRFSGTPLRLIRYPHMHNVTYFGRSVRGGIFLGVELPFDGSAVTADGAISLGYSPCMKVKANQQIVCEAIYLGVYRKCEVERPMPDVGIPVRAWAGQRYRTNKGKHGQEPSGAEEGPPLAAESEAMVAMTATLLPPQHRRLGPLMCGWWSEMTRYPYRTLADAQGDMRSIDFAAECGISVVQDGRTWAGERAKVEALRGDDKLQLGELALKVAEHARKKGVRWMLWSSMNVSDATYLVKEYTPFRADRPEWRMPPHRANNFGYQPFYDWWLQLNFDVMDAGEYEGWCMDGDFFGWQGRTARVDCQLDTQDHICQDVTYLCERNLTNAARLLRQRYPDVYLFYCRPPMDHGIWSLRNVDACFSIDEHAKEIGLKGMGPQPPNVLLGDKIRHWSRIRVHRHFFPHYLDSPQLFTYPKSLWPQAKHGWLSDHLDYILLSAISSAPNQTFYLPSRTGIPDQDKRTLKKWLDWGREKIDYLMVRKDLPDWPQVGKVDGSAHICGDRGFVFLFNPNKKPLHGGFELTEESIGLQQQGTFEVTQEYPESDRRVERRHGETIRWEVPGETAVILEVQPVGQ